jgi:hypothetical protein
MLLCTSWKSRPLTPEATNRMMAIWGKIEADMAASPDWERVSWYMYGDGSGGFTVAEVTDAEAAHRLGLETALSLGEFIELDTRLVHDLESAMPAIMAAVERMNA